MDQRNTLTKDVWHSALTALYDIMNLTVIMIQYAARPNPVVFTGGRTVSTLVEEKDRIFHRLLVVVQKTAWLLLFVFVCRHSFSLQYRQQSLRDSET